MYHSNTGAEAHQQPSESDGSESNLETLQSRQDLIKNLREIQRIRNFLAKAELIIRRNSGADLNNQITTLASSLKINLSDWNPEILQDNDRQNSIEKLRLSLQGTSSESPQLLYLKSLKESIISNYSQLFDVDEDGGDFSTIIDSSYYSLARRLMSENRNLDQRSLEILHWLVDHDNGLIAGTTQDHLFFDRLWNIDHTKSDSVGSALLFGPPGFGKTETLRAFSEDRLGRQARVISINNFTSTDQLLGEFAISIQGQGAIKGSNQIDELIKYFNKPENEIFESLKRNKKSIISFLLSLDPELAIDNEISLQDLLKITGSALKNLQLKSLLSSANEERWVEGEIQSAINQGSVVIFDEIDKANPKLLAIINGLLTAKPGSEYKIGDSTFTIPTWFRIFATANETGEMERYQLDRFELLRVGPPSEADTLAKAAYWLRDKIFSKDLSEDLQWRISLFITHIAPLVHHWYESELKSSNDRSGEPVRPLSLRRLKSICMALANGGNFSETVFQQLVGSDGLAPNITEAEKRLRAILMKFQLFILSNLNQSTCSPQSSPIIRMAGCLNQSTQIIDENKHGAPSERLEPVIGSNKRTVTLPSGLVIEANGNYINYGYTVDGATKTFVSENYNFTIDEIITSDLLGKRVVVKDNNNGYHILSPTSTAEKNSITIDTENKAFKISEAGDSVAVVGEKQIDIYCFVGERAKKIVLSAHDNIESVDFSNDGVFCYINSTLNSFQVNLNTLMLASGHASGTYSINSFKVEQ